MIDWPVRLQDFVDGIATSFAVIGHDENGAPVVYGCNDRFFDMAGGRRPGVEGFPTPLDTVLPSYARHDFRQKLQRGFETGDAQELEQAYDLRDGTHWWRLRMTPFRRVDEAGSELAILVTGVEITEEMQLQHDLEVAMSRFRSVVDAAYDAIITIDQEQNVILFNRAAENLFGYDASEVIGQPIHMLVPKEHRAHHPEYIRQFAKSPVKSRQMDERNLIYGLHRDGTLLPVEIAISKINVAGVIEYTAIVRDIEDRARLMSLFQRQAMTDQLTDLPNRREFLELMEASVKSKQKLSVFMADIDHFKLVNDTYGHDVGDEVLRVLAKVGTATCAKRGIFARWGGEEFVAAFPATDLELARSLADELRTKLEKQDFEHVWVNGQAVSFTISIGVTARDSDERDVAAIMKRADEALYKAKETGRNRVEIG